MGVTGARTDRRDAAPAGAEADKGHRISYTRIPNPRRTT